MFSHKHIWGAIDALAARYGHSPSGLARAAGLDPTTFNKSKRLGPQGRLRWPSTESLSKILVVTGASIEDFVALLSRGGGKAPSRMVPFLKLKDLAKKKAFDGDGKPALKAWERLSFPDLNDDTAFAIEVTGDAAAPVFRDGDVVVVSPTAELRKGDRVLAKTSDGWALMRLVRRTAKKVELKSLNGGDGGGVFDRAKVEWIARVVWARG
ncbi:MAG: helix-turn-helix transcriptional regulator [Alphaproteobacteria bacterium]|nr:helix-turn-helix transcriptional regulator [Alphaproteobacteria bacterium]